MISKLLTEIEFIDINMSKFFELVVKLGLSNNKKFEKMIKIIRKYL